MKELQVGRRGNDSRLAAVEQTRLVAGHKVDLAEVDILRVVVVGDNQTAADDIQAVADCKLEVQHGSLVVRLVMDFAHTLEAPLDWHVANKLEVDCQIVVDYSLDKAESLV